MKWLKSCQEPIKWAPGHVCLLWSKTLGTPDTAQSLKCSHPLFPVQPRSQGFSLTGRPSWFLMCQIYLKGGGGTVSLPPIAKYPDHHLDTFEIKMAGRLPWLRFLALEAGLFGVGGHSFGQTKSLRRMTVTGNCAWKVFGTQGTVFCAIAEK